MSETADQEDDEQQGSPHLDEDEQDQALAHSTPRALVIHEIIRDEGEQELERTNTALALSGLAGGLSMGFSFLALALLRASMPATPWRDDIASFGYSVGFIIVVLGRQQLFTENTLTPVLALIHNRNSKTLVRLLRLWGIVLAANAAGAIAFAFALAHDGAFAPDAMHAFAEIGHQTIRAGFGTTFVRAVYAGWLIALMVWLLPAAEGARPLTIILITYIVALCGLSHVIAGSVDCAYIVATGEATVRDFVVRFFAPTLLGNIVGGVTLVAALNYGQVAPEIEGPP